MRCITKIKRSLYQGIKEVGEAKNNEKGLTLQPALAKRKEPNDFIGLLLRKKNKLTGRVGSF